MSLRALCAHRFEIGAQILAHEKGADVGVAERRGVEEAALDDRAGESVVVGGDQRGQPAAVRAAHHPQPVAIEPGVRLQGGVEEVEHVVHVDRAETPPHGARVRLPVPGGAARVAQQHRIPRIHADLRLVEHGRPERGERAAVDHEQHGMRPVADGLQCPAVHGSAVAGGHDHPARGPDAAAAQIPREVGARLEAALPQSHDVTEGIASGDREYCVVGARHDGDAAHLDGRRRRHALGDPKDVRAEQVHAALIPKLHVHTVVVDHSDRTRRATEIDALGVREPARGRSGVEHEQPGAARHEVAAFRPELLSEEEQPAGRGRLHLEDQARGLVRRDRRDQRGTSGEVDAPQVGAQIPVAPGMARGDDDHRGAVRGEAQRRVVRVARRELPGERNRALRGGPRVTDARGRRVRGLGIGRRHVDQERVLSAVRDDADAVGAIPRRRESPRRFGRLGQARHGAVSAVLGDAGDERDPATVGCPPESLDAERRVGDREGLSPIGVDDVHLPDGLRARPEEGDHPAIR